MGACNGLGCGQVGTNQRHSDSLNPGVFLYVENINQCAIQEIETTLGVLNRKGFNAGNYVPKESLCGLKEQV